MPGAERHDGLAGVDRRPGREVESRPLTVQVLERGEDAESSTHRSFGIVAVGYRRAEHRHDGVADELLEDPAVPLDLRLCSCEIGLEALPDVLRIGLVRASGEAHEVDEQHGDELSLLRDAGVGNQRRAAVQAEPGAVDVVLSAAWTADHAEESMEGRTPWIGWSDAVAGGAAH